MGPGLTSFGLMAIIGGVILFFVAYGAPSSAFGSQYVNYELLNAKLIHALAGLAVTVSGVIMTVAGLIYLDLDKRGVIPRATATSADGPTQAGARGQSNDGPGVNTPGSW